MGKKILVGIKEPKKEVKFIEIEDDYKVMQKVVGGRLDVIANVDDKLIDCWVNDDFLGEASEDNLNVVFHSRRTVVFKNCFFASTDGEGNTVSLSSAQQEWVKNFCKKNDAYIKAMM